MRVRDEIEQMSYVKHRITELRRVGNTSKAAKNWWILAASGNKLIGVRHAAQRLTYELLLDTAMTPYCAVQQPVRKSIYNKVALRMIIFNRT